MGYFRFRRSIKILPGVRWNIGKKSSSISLGGRGFHYTIGPHGNRTTVGLPGTGLSYTTTSAAGRSSKSSPQVNREAALKWAATHQSAFHINLPQKEFGEAPATKKQIADLHGLVKDIQGLDFDSLGAKQAAEIIAAITAEKDKFTEQKVQEYISAQNKGLGCLSHLSLVLFVLAVIIILGTVH